MKLNDISETQDSGPLTSHGNEHVEQIVELLKSKGTHWAAAMGAEEVIHASYNGADFYGRVKDGTITAVGSFTDVGEFYQLNLISNYPMKGGAFNSAKSLLFTVKEYIGKPIIDFGVQSPQGLRFTQALGHHPHFDIYWYNVKTKERIEYDPTTDAPGVKPYRDVRKTDWRILIESAKEGEEQFPREGVTPFGIPHDFFTEEYEEWYQQYTEDGV